MARIFLLLAITTEVGGTSSMKFAESGIWAYLLMYSLISVSYFFLALAVKRISLPVNSKTIFTTMNKRDK
ncbi:SMR family transporter [Neiella marina]